MSSQLTAYACGFLDERRGFWSFHNGCLQLVPCSLVTSVGWTSLCCVLEEHGWRYVMQSKALQSHAVLPHCWPCIWYWHAEGALVVHPVVHLSLGYLGGNPMLVILLPVPFLRGACDHVTCIEMWGL